MKIFEEEDDFILGPVIFGTFLKKWNKKKSGILQQLKDKIKEEPALAGDIQKSLDDTQETIDEFKKALQAYAAAAKEAKVEYDKSKGTAGKVKNFFGMERGGQDDKVFKLNNKKFQIVESGDYSIRDILSMDFNIGLFLDDPLSGERLKQKVKGLLSYRKYLEKDKEDKLSDEKKAEYERADPDKLDGMIFNTLGITIPESLIREDEVETPQGYKDLVAKFKVLYDKKQLEFKTAYKTATSDQQVKKLAFKLFNDPEYSFYLFLIKAKGNTVAKEWSAFKKLSNPPAYFKEVEYLLDKFKKEIYGEDTLSVDLESKSGWKKDTVIAIFAFATSQEKATQRDTDTQETNALKKRFEVAVKKRIKELQKGIPMFIAGAEDELSGDKEDAKLDPVYADEQSLVTKFLETSKQEEVFNFAMAYSNTSTITDEQYKKITGGKDTGVMANFEEYLGTLNDLIEARDKEARRDLTALADFAATQDDKAKKQATAIRNTLGNNSNDTILQVYKQWHDWLEKNKRDLLEKYFEQNNDTLEEQIIKLIKPLLREKLKRKQNG